MIHTIDALTLVAYQAALKAGEKVLEVYESDDFNVVQKADKSPLTLADRRAHELIESALAPTGIPLLSEEGADIPAAERQKWDAYWLIDPLDGTIPLQYNKDDLLNPWFVVKGPRLL